MLIDQCRYQTLKTKIKCVITHSYIKNQWKIRIGTTWFSFILNKWCLRTSVDTEMCCPKGKCGCQYFILLTLKNKKNHGHRGPGFF